MTKPMLNEKEWSRNVGTSSYPVTFLHEYAVGLIWDMLTAKTGTVQLPTLDGSLSEDLMTGVDRVIIPDALQAIAGYIPDISLLRDVRPVRVIEVVVTNPLPLNKVTAMQNLGVEVIQVPVRNEDELLALFPTSVVTEKGIGWWPKYGEKERRAFSKKRFSSKSILDEQGDADREINALMRNLSRCSPEVRREFIEVLKQVSSLESLYPVRPDNPKKKVLNKG